MSCETDAFDICGKLYYFFRTLKKQISAQCWNQLVWIRIFISGWVFWIATKTTRIIKLWEYSIVSPTISLFQQFTAFDFTMSYKFLFLWFLHNFSATWPANSRFMSILDFSHKSFLMIFFFSQPNINIYIIYENKLTNKYRYECSLGDWFNFKQSVTTVR